MDLHLLFDSIIRAHDGPGPKHVHYRTAPAGKTGTLLHAQTLAERRQGLQGFDVEQLGEHDGMMFTYPVDSWPTFTNRGVNFPLEYGFLDAEGYLVHRTVAQPNQDVVVSPVPFRSVVEAPEGRFDTMGLNEPHAQIVVNDDPAISDGPVDAPMPNDISR